MYMWNVHSWYNWRIILFAIESSIRKKWKLFINVEGPRANYIGLLSTSISTIGCDHNSWMERHELSFCSNSHFPLQSYNGHQFFQIIWSHIPLWMKENVFNHRYKWEFEHKFAYKFWLHLVKMYWNMKQNYGEGILLFNLQYYCNWTIVKL